MQTFILIFFLRIVGTVGVRPMKLVAVATQPDTVDLSVSTKIGRTITGCVASMSPTNSLKVEVLAPPPLVTAVAPAVKEVRSKEKGRGR